MSTRSKTPTYQKSKIEKQKVELIDVAEELEKILSKLNNQSDINNTVKQLQDILLDIYTIINENQKNSSKVNIIKVNKKDSEEKKDNEENKNLSVDLKDKENNRYNDANEIIENNAGNIVNLDKEQLKENHKQEQHNFTNSCNNLLFLNNNKKITNSIFNKELIFKKETDKNGNR